MSPALRLGLAARLGRPAPRLGRAVRLGLVACLAAVVTGCADTPRAVGGLQLGLNDAPLRPPVRIDTGDPFEYPADAWEAGISGTTVLKLRISRQGEVDSVMILESSGHPSLDSAALANAARLRYRPATQGGTPVEVWGRLPVVFSVPDEKQSQEEANVNVDTP